MLARGGPRAAVGGDDGDAALQRRLEQPRVGDGVSRLGSDFSPPVWLSSGSLWWASAS